MIRRAMIRRNVIGRMVSRLRYQRDWTQDVLVARLQCEGLDISRDVLANIETGRTEVPDNFLPYFQRAFRVQIIQFFPQDAQDLDEKLCARAAVRPLKTRSRHAKS